MNIIRSALRSAAPLLALAIHTTGLAAQSLSESIGKTSSGDYATRRAGFYRIGHLARADSSTGSSAQAGQRFQGYVGQHPEVASALISLLERENLPDPTKQAMSEDPYYADLIGVVAGLRDPRAANALLGAIHTGKLATEGLSALGQMAVPGLLATLRSQEKHFFARAAAAVVLGTITRQGRGSAADSAATRSGLLGALSDTSMYVRRDAVEALTHFSGADIRRRVSDLAAMDPASRLRSGKRVYPVRAAALAWISHDDSVRTRPAPR
jgi:hypothetical protein